jgi:hypothetical protein
MLLGPALLYVIGCSGDDLDKRYPVSGKVSYKGTPVAKGVINFVPADTKGAGRGAQGQIENGSYTLTTQSPGDGAFPGEYKVTVSSYEADEAAMKAETEKLAKDKGVEKFAGGAMIPQEIAGKAAKQAKRLTPQKYETLSGENTLKATVAATSNEFNFDLKD